MKLESASQHYSLIEMTKHLRKHYIDKGWFMGVSYLDHELSYGKLGYRPVGHSLIDDCYPSSWYDRYYNYRVDNDFHEGEEIYIDDNDENVFVDPTALNVAHILVSCKTIDKIYPKVISLGVFKRSVPEYVSERDCQGNYKKDENGNFIWKHYSDKKEYEDILKILRPQMGEYEIKQYIDSLDFNTLPKHVYPFSNQVHDVYDALRGVKTNLEIWNRIKGRCIKVVNTEEVCTLGLTDRVSVSRTVLGKIREYKEKWPRMVKVPVFTFVNKDINKEIKAEHHYEPRYFIRQKSGNLNYRIIVDEKTQLKGLVDLDKGRKICQCYFDDINHLCFSLDDANMPIELVKFKKDGYEAMCEIGQLKRFLKKQKVKQ